MFARGELIKRLKLSHNLANRHLHQRPDSDFAPESWEGYFDNAFIIETPNGKFHAYSAGELGCNTIVICLHGGGFSSLTWGVFTKRLLEKADVKVFGIDLRGHGETVVPNEQDLSIESLVEDMMGCIEELLNLDKSIPDNPNIILVGHSLGGAIATWLAAPASRISSLVRALIVIDVVEGSAIASLSHMNNILHSRPRGFETLKDAIMWSVSKSQAEDFTALRVSVPGQLKHIESNNSAVMYVKEEKNLWHTLQSSQSAMTELTLNNDQDVPGSAFHRIPLSTSAHRLPQMSGDSTINDCKCRIVPDLGLPPINGNATKDQVVPKSNSSVITPPGMFRPIAPAPRKYRPGLTAVPQKLLLEGKTSPSITKDRYTWRVNLHASSSYWPNWFNGMSERFLESRANKLLILCGEDRMDTTLHRGYMQGKFKIQIIKCGHQIQEDKPDELSSEISMFLTYHQLCKGK